MTRRSSSWKRPRSSASERAKYLDELAKAADPRAREVRGELGKLFHRLKGSALVVAEDAIATGVLPSVARERRHKTSAAVLQRGLARVTQLLQSERAEEPSFSSAAAKKPARRLA